MLHDSGGDRRFQVVRSACHLRCAVNVLDARGADLVKYLNWFVDLIISQRDWERDVYNISTILTV